MSNIVDAIAFHSVLCVRHVAAALKSLMKGVQSNGEVDEDDLEDMVRPLVGNPLLACDVDLLLAL